MSYKKATPNGQSNDTHLVKLISLLPFPYYLAWPFISFVFLMISFGLLLLSGDKMMHIDAFFIVSAIIAMEGTIISWAYHRITSFEDILISIVDMDKDEISKAWRKHESEIFDDKGMLFFSIVFILFVHMAGIDYHLLSFNSYLPFLSFKIGYYFAVYLESIGLYILILTALTVYKFGEYPLRIDSLYSDFHSIGILYLKFTICAAVVYIVWGFFHIIVPPQFSSVQMILWFLSFAFLLFAYFILPQYRIHRMMTSTKREKMELFSSQFRAAMDKSLDIPTKEKAYHLKDMFIVQERLKEMSEWPFGSKEILYLVLIIIIPLLVVLLEIAFKIIKINE
jgi:hypothetical protein